jgi:hypothetical protein
MPDIFRILALDCALAPGLLFSAPGAGSWTSSSTGADSSRNKLVCHGVPSTAEFSQDGDGKPVALACAHQRSRRGWPGWRSCRQSLSVSPQGVEDCLM